MVLAHDLTPSETANLDPKFVYAFATEAGGKASHTAIMAGVLEIPAVVGLGRLLMDVSGGDEVIVDGNRGVVILNPDEETRERYARPAEQFRTFAKRARRAARSAGRDARWRAQAMLLGNIEFPAEANHCNRPRRRRRRPVSHRIPLPRTRTEDPDESEQYEAYMAVLRTHWAAQAGRHPHARPRRGQVLPPHRRAPG